jgi:hypothetical protein
MWNWVYTAIDRQSGITVVEIKTADRRASGQEQESLTAKVEIETHPGRNEIAIRLEALQKLRTLIDDEMARLGRQHGGAEE